VCRRGRVGNAEIATQVLLMKKKKKQKLKILLGIKLGWLLILLWGKLIRIKKVGQHNWRTAVESGNGALAMIWHGRILLPIYVHRKQGITPMVSLHSDGEMIAQTIHRLGYSTVRGSSTRGGKEAFHEMLSLLKQGASCAIMPDGPRGPRHKLKSGTVQLGYRSGAYLVPITFSCKKGIFATSWDKFLVAKPFSTSFIFYDKPIQIPPNLSTEELEQYRQKIEDRMKKFEKFADAYVRKEMA